MERQVELCAGDYRLVLTPERGGSIARFDWRCEPLMRPTCGPSIFDTACFPLVPFSNRIANGRFIADERQIDLSRNFPGSDHPHTIHGFGWLAAWEVVSCTTTEAMVRHIHPGGEWPWPYVAEQEFSLSEEGLRHALRVENRGDTPMPTGLGFHPYFPCTARTMYHGAHKGEWRTAPDGLPLSLDIRDVAIDWWHGAAAARRVVDTVYADRRGPLSVQWPERGLEVVMTPSNSLPFTVVFTPYGSPFFCVEPVSHETDAINAKPMRHPMLSLAPFQSFEVEIAYHATTLNADRQRN